MMKRSKLITKIIVLALVVYAGVSLVAIRARTEAARKELDELRRLVAELEISNAEHEYNIEHYDDPEVIADIARSRLGLVLPGELVFYDSADGQTPVD